MVSRNSKLYTEFTITHLDDEEPLDLTVSSSKNSEHRMKSKVSAEPKRMPNKSPSSPQKTQKLDTKSKTLINLQEIMDSNVIGAPIRPKVEEKPDLQMQAAKETIFTRVILTKFNEILSVEKSMMQEIIRKDSEREQFYRDLMVKLQVLQKENHVLTSENRMLKEMMSVWKISN